MPHTPTPRIRRSAAVVLALVAGLFAIAGPQPAFAIDATVTVPDQVEAGVPFTVSVAITGTSEPATVSWYAASKYDVDTHIGGCVFADKTSQTTTATCDAVVTADAFQIVAEVADSTYGYSASHLVNSDGIPIPDPSTAQLTMTITPGIPLQVLATVTRDGKPALEQSYVDLLLYEPGRPRPVSVTEAFPDQNGQVHFSYPLIYHGGDQPCRIAVRYNDFHATLRTDPVDVKTPLVMVLTDRTRQTLTYQLHDADGPLGANFAPKTRLQAAPGPDGPWTTVAHRRIQDLNVTYDIVRGRSPVWYRAVAPATAVRATAISTPIRVG